MTPSHHSLWQETLTSLPLVAILRGMSPAEALDIADALYDAGFRCLEVPLNSPEALTSIAAIRQRYDGKMLVGAGTVLSVEQIGAIHRAGAQLAVSPNADPTVIRAAKKSGMISIPGFQTPTEAFAAAAAGADALKLFPAEGTPPIVLRAMKAVLPPSLPILPVGGVTPSTMKTYVAAGAAGFGIGSSLYSPGTVPEEVRIRAIALVAAWATIKR